MLDTISGYYDKNYIKSLSKDGKPLRLEDLSDYFDAGKTREITDEFGNKYEITLGDEIAAITQEFLGEFDLLKPDITALKNTAGAYVLNSDLFLPADDLIVNTNSPYGAMQIELLNAFLNDADMDAFVNDINAVANDYLPLAISSTAANMEDAGIANSLIKEPDKAIYKVFDPQYDLGVIPYCFGDDILFHLNIEPEHIEALEEAYGGLGGRCCRCRRSY